MSLVIFFNCCVQVLESLGLARDKLTLNEHFSRLHLPCLPLHDSVEKVVVLLICAEGVQYTLASAQKGIFVVLGDIVEATIEGALLLVKDRAEAHALLHLGLLFRLIMVELLVEVPLEVALQHLHFIPLVELELESLQFCVVVAILLEEALEEGKELFAPDLPHLLLRNAFVRQKRLVRRRIFQAHIDPPPLVLPSEVPFRLVMRRLPPLARSIDAVPNGLDR